MLSLALLVAATTLPGCGVRGLAFRADDRIDVVAPRDRAEVSLPVTVRWTAHDPHDRFGVFVDRAPQPPGRPLSWLARGDRSCESTRGCPDAEYLAQRNVFSTADTSFTVEQLADTQSDGRQSDVHEVTVVLLDEQDRRIGESAWTVEFRLAGDEGRRP